MSGLIYAAIVAAWGAYLVPLALRRHDEAMRIRSVDRFSAAMRVLARRPAPADRAVGDQTVGDRAVGDPAEPGPVPVPPASLRKPAGARVEPALPARPSKAAVRRAAARRRRVLSILLLLTVAVDGLAFAGIVAWWAVAAPLVVVVAFLFACRRQVRTDTERSWSDSAARLPAGSRRGARVDATYGAIGDIPDDSPTVVLRRDGGADSGVDKGADSGADSSAEKSPPAEKRPAEPPEQVVAVAVATDGGGSLWDPLPVTLPTYVSAPKAPRTLRTVDLSEPGTWSSGRLTPNAVEDSPAAGPAATSPGPQGPADETEAPARRAVGS
jgi:hypothetical protein